jgi:hypothetical protein
MKHKKYRIYVLGPIPPDLKERVAAVHADALLQAKKEDIPVHTQVKNRQNRGAAKLPGLT